MATPIVPRTRNKPSLPTLQECQDNLTLQLEKLTCLDLEPMKESYEELRQLALTVKPILAVYSENSRRLSQKLVDSGAIDEARSIRESRNEMQKDCKEVIKSINYYLTELRRTNVSNVSSEVTPNVGAATGGGDRSGLVFTPLAEEQCEVDSLENETTVIPTVGLSLHDDKCRETPARLDEIHPKETVSYQPTKSTSTGICSLTSFDNISVRSKLNSTIIPNSSHSNIVPSNSDKYIDSHGNVCNLGEFDGGIGNVRNSNFANSNIAQPASYVESRSSEITRGNLATVTSQTNSTQILSNTLGFRPIVSDSDKREVFDRNNIKQNTNDFEPDSFKYNQNDNIKPPRAAPEVRTVHYSTSHLVNPTQLDIDSKSIHYPHPNRKPSKVYYESDTHNNRYPTAQAHHFDKYQPGIRYSRPDDCDVYQWPNPPTRNRPGEYYPTYNRHQTDDNGSYHANNNNTYYPRQHTDDIRTQTDVLSSFLLTQDLVRKSITAFDGTPTNFWPWLNKIRDYTSMLKLSPLQTLQLYESHTTGDPQRMITQKLASTGRVTSEDIDDVCDTLVRRYGSTQRIANDILSKVDKFPLMKNPNMGDQLEDFHDLCKVVLYNASHCPELRMMDLSIGLNRVRAKLPEFIQREWAKVGQRHEDEYGSHPPFSVFVDFIKKQARLQSNRNYETIASRSYQNPKTTRVMRTSTSQEEKDITPAPNNKEYCLFHKSESHSFLDCTSFKKLEFTDRKKFIFESRLCYICLGQHKAANCTSESKCAKCNKRHHTLMHRDYPPKDKIDLNPPETNGQKVNSTENVTTLCTAVCGNKPSINCSKTLLVDLTMKDVPGRTLTGYCIIDEQSNTTLVDDEAVKFFGKEFPTQAFKMRFARQDYTLDTEGSVITGLRVRGVHSEETIEIDKALSSPNITDTTDEVATPAMVRAHRHTKKYAKFFPEFDPKARVLILIGRDCGRAMATKCLNSEEPYVHKTPLGYSLVGNVCKGDKSPNSVTVLRTQSTLMHEPVTVDYNFTSKKITEDVFYRQADDNQPGLSVEDRQFLEKMNSGVCVTPDGNLELPLPYKEVQLPNNKIAVYNRTLGTLNRLQRNEIILSKCTATMKKNLDANYVEQISESEIEPTNPTWYLPIFDVNSAKKTRLVYDASARYKNVSLNDAMMTGPDLNNFLRSVLTKFREKPVAFAADIESMFSTFKVPKDQQDLLRFFWFRDNDPSNELVPYRSTSHIFGCSCSPAIANFALKYCASIHEDDNQLHDSVEYLKHSFYVDDGVSSADSPEKAVETLAGAIGILRGYNIRLHKIVSNHQSVIDGFPASEIAPLDKKKPRILGVCWDTDDDSFSIEYPPCNKPYTRRGVLSFNNSFYDPIGFISPIILTGRLFQRKVLPPADQTPSDLKQHGWDDELPVRFRAEWDTLTSNCSSIEQLKLNRSFYPIAFSPVHQDLHIFSDASDNAIGFVAYLRSVDENDRVEVTFVTASSKVSPRAATTIPRLELCAAAEAANCQTRIIRDLRVQPADVHLYTDSLIVLGYLTNSRKRFSKYVENRVANILDHTKKEQWNYVHTTENPADLASRPCHKVEDLVNSHWLHGPAFLHNITSRLETESIPLTESLPEEKKEKEVQILRTHVKEPSSLNSLYERTSKWTKITRATQVVMKIFHLIDVTKQKLGISLAPRNPSPSQLDATTYLIRESQQDSFGDTLSHLHKSEPLPDASKISKLSPYLEIDDTIRVGGRLKNCDIPFHVKHPLLIPKNHPIQKVIIQHVHDKVKHQGNHITHGSIINSGFHLEDGRQAVRSFIGNCVICRRLRGSPPEQIMADLPADRLEQTAPFENVGLDVFGPFHIHDGATTRRTTTTKKVWALIFVCLPSRAIHLEPLTGMDVTSFRNALCRFIAIRGPVKLVRSDRGTNFIAARSQMDKEKINLEDLTSVMDSQGIEWILNPPHASHHGGAWERKIGSVRRVLEASLLLASNRGLSRDEFHTVLTEAASVVNHTPLWPASSSPNDPSPVTPNMLLTLRSTEQNRDFESYTEKDLLAYGPRRHRRVQYLCDQFWTRWRKEYIHSLSQRQKWKRAKPCVKVGDLVLMRNRQVPRNHWPMARVSAVKPGDDGLVRSVSLLLHKPSSNFGTRCLDRPISEVVVLISA